MHAPATPGDSVPGDAAGDDSGQGSGSNEPEVEKVTLTLNCNYDAIPVPSGGGLYDKGSTVRIEAIDSVDVTDVSNNRSEYEFMKWSDGNTQRVRDIVLENDLALTAEYNSVGLY